MLSRTSLLLLIAACAPAAPTFSAIPAASSSSSVLALPPPSSSASAAPAPSSSTTPDPSPMKSADFTFELIPAMGAESTPRDLFLVAPALGLRQKIATYTIPDVCYLVSPPPTSLAPTPTSTRLATFMITCNRPELGGANITIDADTLVVESSAGERRFLLAKDATFSVGMVPLARRDCDPAPPKPIAVAIRRHVRASEHAFHELWLEAPALKMKTRIGSMFHELGCNATIEAGGGVELTCATKIGAPNRYEMHVENDWLRIDAPNVPGATLLPCGARVTFEKYSDRVLAAVPGAPPE